MIDNFWQMESLEIRQLNIINVMCINHNSDVQLFSAKYSFYQFLEKGKAFGDELPTKHVNVCFVNRSNHSKCDM